MQLMIDQRPDGCNKLHRVRKTTVNVESGLVAPVRVDVELARIPTGAKRPNAHVAGLCPGGSNDLVEQCLDLGFPLGKRVETHEHE